MGFWVFMLLMNMLLPFCMIGFGRWMWKIPPATINDLLGYRTTMSKKNQDTWRFAHTYCGRLWWKIGWVMLPISIVWMLFLIGKSTDRVGTWGGILCILQCVILVGSIYPVEKALGENFDKDGNRRNIV